MKNYASHAMELAPRDIVARSIQTEINEGRGINKKDYVYLDLRHLGEEKIKERLPGIREICMDFAGIDPIHDPIPVQPGQHYSMGGIRCTTTGGNTALEGLYAVGEVSAYSIHGANRLGGNSLLETVVFGKQVGLNIVKDLAKIKSPDPSIVEPALEKATALIQKVTQQKGEHSLSTIREELRRIMIEHFVEGVEPGEMQGCQGAQFISDPGAHGGDFFRLIVELGDNQVDDFQVDLMAAQGFQGVEHRLQFAVHQVPVKLVVKGLEIDAGGIQESPQFFQGLGIDVAR